MKAARKTLGIRKMNRNKKWTTKTPWVIVDIKKNKQEIYKKSCHNYIEDRTVSSHNV